MGIPIRSRVLRSELEGPARQSVSKVPSLEKMSEDFVPSVVSLSVGPLKPLHPIHQVALRSFNQQMVMIVHQHVSMRQPVFWQDSSSVLRKRFRSVSSL